MSNRSVLILGARSFAAQGLAEQLRQEGWQVTTFTRGPLRRDGDWVTGPVFDLLGNPHLQDSFAVVVNYIVLKDTDVTANEAYIDALMAFCSQRQVPRLVHISSVSVYASDVQQITETALAETCPQRKGAYGSLKVAAELRLRALRPATMQVTHVRPGFILGPGLVSPIIGMGFRFGANRLLQFGSGLNAVPITTRPLVNRAIVHLLREPVRVGDDVVLLADVASPSRREWLGACCTYAGAGVRVLSVPVWCWYLAGLGGEIVARLLRLKLHPWNTVRNACRCMRYDARATEQRLGLSLTCDWRRELVASLDYQAPPQALRTITPPAWHLSSPAGRLAIIGYGGIVQQRHLPALRTLGYRGTLEAYDVQPRVDKGQVVSAVETFAGGAYDLTIVASPGTVHNQSLPLLQKVKGPIVVEKPLCCTANEYAAWTAFAEQRAEPVIVCHNYRFKENVLRMAAHLRAHPPGRLWQAHVEFQSPPVNFDQAGWRKQERVARTLLTDYGMHFLDLACMFDDQQWQVERVRHALNHAGETACIEGRLVSPSYPVSFILRQGFQPRRCRLMFTFQNYSVSLGFFPDTFVAHMANDGSGLHAAETRECRRAERSKILDKVRGRNSDQSHTHLFALATSKQTTGSGLRVGELQAFYQVLFAIGERVYGA